MAFTGMLCDDLLLKEHFPRTREKLERDCLEHHSERSLKLCDWSSTQIGLFLLTGEAGIVNVQGCVMHWYLSWLTCWTKHTDTVKNHLQSFWKFAEISMKVSVLIYLYIWAENQIFFKTLFFSSTVLAGSFDFIH